MECCERAGSVGRRVGVGEERASRLLATTSRAISYKMFLGFAFVAFEPVAIGAKRIAGASEAHPARPALALAFALALPEADEHGGELVLGGVGEEGACLAFALALALALDDPPNASRRLVASVAAPTRLGVLVGPEQVGRALVLGQALDVAEVVLVAPQRADGIGVRATSELLSWVSWGPCWSGAGAICSDAVRIRSSRAKG